jgi:sarcosine dehydrogenase
VGGGIAGCSLAYHLAELGVRGVVLLEQNRLAAGTTWHAAGAVGRMRVSAGLARLNDRSAALYRRVAQESGLETGWREAGGITIARTAERLLQLRRAAAMARRFGVQVDELPIHELRELWPLARFDDVAGAMLLPGDGIVEPRLLTEAVGAEARRRGVDIREGVTVTSIDCAGGVLTGVRTTAGPVDAPVVVLCTGMWTRQLAAPLDLHIPMQAVQHHYALSRDTGQDLDHLPVVRDPDGSIYFRGKGRSLMLGAFQAASKPWLVDRIAGDFAFALLDPDWEHFAEPLREGQRRLPALEDLGFERFVNGPESFTPDGNPLVGEVPGVRRLYVAAGFNSSGLAYAGGVGEALAQWIAADEPPFDMWMLDIRRFRTEQADGSYLRARGVEVLGTHMRMGYPNIEFTTGRGLVRTPLHERTAGAGACFGEKLGVERPLWFAPPGAEPEMRYSFDRQNWFEYSRAEHLATRSDVAVFDQSGFSQYDVTGRDALALLQRTCANDVDVEPGRVVYTAMLTSRGTFASDLTVIRTGESTFLAVTGTAQAVADRTWLERHVLPGEDVAIRDGSAAGGVLGVMGPRSRDLLAPLADADLSDAAFPFATSRLLRMGGVPCRAVRITYVGELGWELYTTREDAPALYDAIWAAGGDHGLVNGGHYAINSLRLEKGYRAWGSDLTMDDTPLEAGLAFAVAWEKAHSFTGRDALVRLREDGPPSRRLVSVVLDDPDPVLWGGELIYREGICVGHTTSGAYGHSLDASVGLGYVGSLGEPITEGLLREGGFEIDVAGRRFGARASLTAPYDPARERILC